MRRLNYIGFPLHYRLVFLSSIRASLNPYLWAVVTYIPVMQRVRKHAATQKADTAESDFINAKHALPFIVQTTKVIFPKFDI